MKGRVTTDAPKPAKPLYVTLLACIGWIGLAIAIARRNSYVSQHDFLNEIPGEGEADVLMSWCVAGVVMVALDAFRGKSDSETRIWRIAVFSFGLCVSGLVSILAALLGLDAVGVGSGFIDVILVILALPASALMAPLFVTVMLGTPALTLFMTVRAIRSWWRYLRTA